MKVHGVTMTADGQTTSTVQTSTVHHEQVIDRYIMYSTHSTKYHMKVHGVTMTADAWSNYQYSADQYS